MGKHFDIRFKHFNFININKTSIMRFVVCIFSALYFISCNNSEVNTHVPDSIKQESVKSDTVEKTNESKYALTISGSCSYTGELNSNSVYSFTSDNEAQTALNRIMNYTGLPANFKLKAADVDNACAVIQHTNSGDNERYILYNQQFMMSVQDLTKNHWSEISILAHEIGHHLSGHTLLHGGSRPDIELEADRFSGFILYKMGASLDDAQIAMKTLGAEMSSSTHPAKRSRLVAITNGWLAAKEQDNTKTESANSTADKTNMTIETPTISLKDSIISILNRYYKINEAYQCDQLAVFYTPYVEKSFEKSNQTNSEIIDDCIKYHSKWAFNKMNIDFSTLSITRLSGGDYFVTYNMFYQVKRKIEDNWKDFYLTINIKFTPELKIKSIYEYHNPKH